MSLLLLFIIIPAALAVCIAVFLSVWVLKQNPGNDQMIRISNLIHNGSAAFLDREYMVMLVFMIVLFIAMVLGFDNGLNKGIAFILGCIFSGFAGRIGMFIATRANTRTAFAVESDIKQGLQIAFSSGLVMGFSVAGLVLLGITGLYYLWKDPDLLFSFGFGASYLALFARVGGGIFTKAADIGADMVGKIEKHIPEDDHHNPAVIADNVGDNVGDVAGMGADLFESFVESIVAAIVIGQAVCLKNPDLFPGVSPDAVMLLPLYLCGIGIVASFIGMFFVKPGKSGNLYNAINKGIFVSSVLMAAGAYGIIMWLTSSLYLFFATCIGLVAGIIIGISTEHYTSAEKRPTEKISESAKTGPATVLIEGIALGMWSTIIPVVVISIVILLSYFLVGVYGVAIAAVGLLSTLAITLAADSYGPVADNAAGIAEMAELGEDVRARAEALDEVGNTTAAIGKGFAISSAALTSIVLYIGFAESAGLAAINVLNPHVIIGLFIGAVLPFIFSSFLLTAVGKAAFKMINEVRRQFVEIPGIMTDEAEPDYKACIHISTQAALKEMIIPGIIAIVTPLLIGFTLGVEALGGLLVGTSIVGFILAIFFANSGGSWDNAKKYIEAGHYGGKGSEPHDAAVVGDTVGDPFKDTAGPALNILMKLISITALVFLPLFL